MAWSDKIAHEETCEHRMIKCKYCEKPYKPDEEELHLQECWLYWKEKCKEYEKLANNAFFLLFIVIIYFAVQNIVILTSNSWLNL